MKSYAVRLSLRVDAANESAALLKVREALARAAVTDRLDLARVAGVESFTIHEATPSAVETYNALLAVGDVR